MAKNAGNRVIGTTLFFRESATSEDEIANIRQLLCFAKCRTRDTLAPCIEMTFDGVYMKADLVSQWVMSGGYVLETWQIPDVPVDSVDARIYTHPGMQREIVRLSPESLTAGEDNAMDLLGFQIKESISKVAIRARQALGFPEWVLIHSPKDVRLALDTAKQMKKAMRQAQSKPGHARDAINAMGATLEKSTPNFLPSFYEEVARGFVNAGNTTIAGTFFGKAREVEQKYALPVDENQRREAFVEFALSGALTNKVMTEYGKTLTKEYGAEVAYENFFDLCVRRTMGGSPPSASLVTDLQKLAKAAKKSVAEEDRRFVNEVFESPALMMAQTKFWESYRAAYIELAAKNPHVKGILLNLFPKPGKDADSFGEFWLGFLRDCAALEALIAEDPDSVPAETRCQGPVTEWWKRLMGMFGEYYWSRVPAPDSCFELLKEITPRILKEGNPIDVDNSTGDADLMDWALELGLTLPPECEINLGNWADGNPESPYRLRDMAFLSAHPVYSKMLADAVRSVVSDQNFQKVSKGKSGLFEAKKAWLDESVAALSQGHWSAWKDHVGVLANSVSAALFAEFPEHYKQLMESNPVDALKRSLQAGVYEELVWPTYEAAVADLKASTDLSVDEVKVDALFPNAIVYNSKKAIVLGPTGRVLEHDFPFKSKGTYEVNYLRYAGGQLMVCFEHDWETKGYWSGKPKTFFEPSYWRSGYLFSTTMKDGRLFDGQRAWGPYEHEIPDTSDFVSDGVNYWVRNGWYNDARLEEIDPETGEVGRESLPAFFETFASPDHRLNLYASKLIPMPEGLASIVPTKDGLWGHVARTDITSDETQWFSITGELVPEEFLGRVTFPGAKSPSILKTGWNREDEAFTIQGEELPWPFIFFMNWRDESGSKVLRQVEEATVSTWIQAALKRTIDAGTHIAPGNYKDFCDRLEKFGKSDVPMPFGETLHGFFQNVAEVVLQLLETLEASNPEHVENSGFVYSNVLRGMRLFGVYYYGYHHDNINGNRVITALAQGLQTGVLPAGLFENVPTEFTQAILEPEVVYWFASRSSYRADFAGMFRQMAATGFGFEGIGRILDVEEVDHQKLGITEDTGFSIVGYKDSYVMVFPYSTTLYQWGVGTLPDLGMKIELERVWTIPKAATLEQWADVLESEQVSQVTPELVGILSQASGLGIPEATLLWAGLPDVMEWGKYSKEQLAEWGLKAKQASTARDTFRYIHRDTLRAPIREALSATDDVFGADGAQALGLAWAKCNGKAEGVEAADLEFLEGLEGDAKHALEMIMNPEHKDWPVRSWKISKSSYYKSFELALEGENGFCSYTFSNLLKAMVQLSYAAPVDHPLRARLLPALGMIRANMSDDRVLVSLDHPYGWVWGDEEVDKQVQMIGVPKSGKKPYLDEGLTIAFWDSSGVEIHMRAARYLKGERNGHFETAMKSDGEYGNVDKEPIFLLDFFASDALETLLEWAAAPGEGNPYNPLEMAPDLVKDVSGTLNISLNAASLLLQTMVFADVKSASVRTYNGWSAKQYNDACKELTEAGIFIEAKRSRAGRKHFLDGPWVEQGNPYLPYEAWKAPYLSLVDDNFIFGQRPKDPPAVLMADAWRRWKSGDKPGFTRTK